LRSAGKHPLLQIARRELPGLVRIGQALGEPAALLALADVEEELHAYTRPPSAPATGQALCYNHMTAR